METRKFLIAHPDNETRTHLENQIREMISNSQCVIAEDGSEASFKLSNAPINVAILAIDLPKRSGFQITDWILAEKDFGALAIILIGAIPESEKFVDDVVTGRVHFLEDPKDPAAIETAVVRAMNFCFHGRHENFDLRFMAHGEVLMKEGEKPDNVYLLRKGKMRAIRKVNGKEIILGFVEPGEFVGEMAYVNQENRSAEVIAENACELIEIPISRIDYVLFQRPAWAKALMKTLSKRLKSANDFRSDQ